MNRPTSDLSQEKRASIYASQLPGHHCRTR
jgi:hypothetical protein